MNTSFIHHIAALSLLASTLCAQDAAPADRNAANSTVLPTDMRADSPVKFPEKGALPSKYPEDVKTQGWPSEKDYFLFSSPGRSLAQISAIQNTMPPGEFTPPVNDWKHLPRTRKILTEGGDLHLMAVGDSIVNDTMRSGWVAKLQEAYPKAKIKATVYVRGGGGCHHYKEEGRVGKFIVPAKPDLVHIGGISQKDVESIREVIGQIRAALPDVEFLLTSGAFGSTDPRNAAALAKAPHSGTGDYGEALRKLAEEQRCAYLDLTTPWRDYIVSSKLHPHLFYRDIVHANEHGEQILSKILMAFWNPPKAGAARRQTAPAHQQAPVDFNHPPRDYATHRLCGWEVLVEKQLADDAPELAAKALARVETKLGEAAKLLPAAALPDLRKLKVFILYGPKAKAGGRSNGLEYFQAKSPRHWDWLDARMASSIVIFNAANYLKLSEAWALKSLVHEFGHAQHLEHWPEDRADIFDTWQAAKKAGLYQTVREEDKGTHNPNYAAQNHLEYLAELTAMYFVGANYFPKDRAGLKAYDPAGYALIEKLWGVHEPPPASERRERAK
jgi:hypothetical protein